MAGTLYDQAVDKQRAKDNIGKPDETQQLLFMDEVEDVGEQIGTFAVQYRDVDTGVVESLFSADFAYLQDFYRRINENGTAKFKTVCPECKHDFEVDLGNLGG